MAHSAQTETLNLPIFSGNDHPTFQGDFNSAFQSIDLFSKTTNTNLNTLQAKTQILENQNTSINDSINDLTSICSDLSSSVTSLSNQNGITQDALNSLTNTVSHFESDIQTALTDSNEALNQAQIAFSNTSSQGNRVTNVEKDIESLTSKLNATPTFSEANFKKMVLDLIFPVGSVYLTMGSNSPQTSLGGTWSKISSNYYMRTTTSASSAGNTGGSNNISFTLTVDNSPWQGSGAESSGYGLTSGGGFTNRVAVNRSGDRAKTPVSTTVTPQYVYIVMWKRTA